MAVTYVNNWNNLLTAIKSKIASEFKCPVYSGWNLIAKGNQFIRVIPKSSDQLEKATFLEHRIFNMDLQFYALRRADTQFEKFILENVSRLEAHIHENLTMTLADNSRIVDVTMGLCELDHSIDDDEVEKYFIVNWDLTCEHYGNEA